MNVEDFTFHLPPELIAARPAEKRDGSRLMVVRRSGKRPVFHTHFSFIGNYLFPGDLLVVNDTKVLPARLFIRRAGGGRGEVLLLESLAPAPDGSARWTALVRPGKKIQPGDLLTTADESASPIMVEEALAGGERVLRFATPSSQFSEFLRTAGHMPLPPYIIARRVAEWGGDEEHAYEDADRERYQTVYAREEGSVAAPTAGLHFTPELLAALEKQGIHRAAVTLHVGAGTFQTMPEGGRVEDHVMHEEQYQVPVETAEAIRATRAAGGRVIAVGTTAVRTLEAAATAQGIVASGANRTAIMITPGHHFRALDGLITNFHLPRSTLLLLVSALMTRPDLLSAYEEAVRQRYRFFSYGDAMLIVP